ncbi:hypothetical protein [Tropicimonas marinistellae]|uniref:hypothetical protein n=1 Tax=Tropicimonas marinistellae TaxID=1739787 RepID=UPI00122DF39F|nr:hypothetical protein [Tropicimonas marinistellae]
MTEPASLFDLWLLLPAYAAIFSLFAWKSLSEARQKQRLSGIQGCDCRPSLPSLSDPARPDGPSRERQ